MHLVTAAGVVIFLWEYWKARNDYIFQDLPIFQNAIISKVCLSPFLVLNSSKIASRRLISPPSGPKDMVIGYFDGAASAGSCGAGMVLLVNSSQSYRLCMDVGYGLNTRSKLLAFSGLLHFALHKNYQTPHVHGDSKVVIEWAKGIYDIHSMELEH